MKENKSLPECHFNLVKDRDLEEGIIEKLILLKLADLSSDRHYSKKLRSKQTRNQDVAKRGIVHELTSYFNRVSQLYTDNGIDETITKLVEEGNFKFPFTRVIKEGSNTDISHAVTQGIKEYNKFIEVQHNQSSFSEKLYDSLVKNIEKILYK